MKSYHCSPFIWQYGRLPVVLLAPGLASSRGLAQTVVNATTTTSGNWTSSSTWTCTPALSPCMPNDGTPPGDLYDVTIGQGGAPVLDSASTQTSITVGIVTTSTSDPYAGSSLDVADSESLTVAGDLTNGTNLGIGAVGNGGTSSLIVGGNLVNNGVIQVGNGTEGNGTESAVVLVNGTLQNAGIYFPYDCPGTTFDVCGVLQEYGGLSVGVHSTVTVEGVAPSTFTGDVELYGEAGGAVLNYGTGAITQLGTAGVTQVS